MSGRVIHRGPPNPELCRFFEEVRQRFFPNNPLNFKVGLYARANEALAGLNLALAATSKFETARRTAAPAQVPAVRCDSSRPKRAKSSRGKPRKRARK